MGMNLMVVMFGGFGGMVKRLILKINIVDGGCFRRWNMDFIVGWRRDLVFVDFFFDIFMLVKSYIIGNFVVIGISGLVKDVVF